MTHEAHAHDTSTTEKALPQPGEGHNGGVGDGGHAHHARTAAAGGVTLVSDGYVLDLHTRSLVAERPGTVELVILGPDGEPVTDFEVAHDKELHLIIAGRDLRGFAHVHPTRDHNGVWSVEVPGLDAGSYRVFADFVTGGAGSMTLGHDLTVLGEVTEASVPAPSRSAMIDGYDVAFRGDLAAGRESTLTVTVAHNGVPVVDLEPYLGALGHLVAIRDGDMAYLHVHPLDAPDGPGGPDVHFSVVLPSAGTFGLFFDFSHRGRVRTAQVVATAASVASAQQTSAPHE